MTTWRICWWPGGHFCCMFWRLSGSVWWTFRVGQELCNAYTELNDPEKQLACFQAWRHAHGCSWSKVNEWTLQEQALAKSQGDEAPHADADKLCEWSGSEHADYSWLFLAYTILSGPALCEHVPIEGFLFVSFVRKAEKTLMYGRSHNLCGAHSRPPNKWADFVFTICTVVATSEHDSKRWAAQCSPTSPKNKFRRKRRLWMKALSPLWSMGCHQLVAVAAASTA